MKHTLNSNDLILLGDTHSTDTVYAIVRTRIPEGSNVLHVGDVGIGFRSQQDDIRAMDYLNVECVEKNICLYLIRGNHDDPNYFWVPDGPRFYSNIIFVRDYDTLNFPNGKTALAVGGGISIDRTRRTIGKSYWAEEVTLPSENKLSHHDYIFAHDSPSWVGLATDGLKKNFPNLCNEDSTLLEDCRKQRKIMDDIFDQVKPSQWFFGHYHFTHSEVNQECTFRCLDINELYFLDTNV